MSRQEFHLKNYCLVAGNNTRVGNFFQIWRQPKTEQQQWVFKVDSIGVTTTEECPKMLERLAIQLHKQFRQCRDRGNIRPMLHPLDVSPLAKMFNLDIKQQLFKLFS